MKPERVAPTWHAAGELTEEDFYEPDTDEYRWAGGFSGVTVEAEDRRITVGTTSRTCPGVRIAGEHEWSGSVLYGDARLNITTTSPRQELAVRTCVDPESLTRQPPQAT